MDSVINKLTEIEEAAAAVVAHAEEQKAVLDEEYEERKKAFDRDLEERTQKRLQGIRDELEEEKKRLLEGQTQGSETSILRLREVFECHHTEYAREILARITEV